MKCPRCHKHRIRYKETKPHGFTFAPIKVKYCIGCGWEKVVEPKGPYYDYSRPPCPDNCPVCAEQNDATKATMAEFDAEQKKRAEEHKGVPVVEQQNPPAVSEWIGQVTKDLSDITGIPAEVLTPKEPSKADEPKESPKKGIIERFLGLFESSPKSPCSMCQGTGKVENRSGINCKIPDTCWANAGSCKNCEWNGGSDAEEVCSSCGGTGEAKP